MSVRGDFGANKAQSTCKPKGEVLILVLRSFRDVSVPGEPGLMRIDQEDAATCMRLIRRE
jgi:hypothetical protein